MKQITALFIIGIVLVVVLSSYRISFAAETSTEPMVNFEQIFGKWDGAFVLLLPDGDTIIYNATRCSERLSPCSTFKLPNSMIGIETGAMKGVDDTLRWDGEQRTYDSWNHDHTLRSAIRYSVVWYYQELARRVGAKRMQYWLDTLRYGNCDMSGGIDRFWLSGTLKVSAFEQVDFLRRWSRDELPFTRKTMDLVRQISVLDSTAEYVLRGKTGTGIKNRPDRPDTIRATTNKLETELGWFVGYVERSGAMYPFALNITGKEATGQIAKGLALAILRELSLINPAEENGSLQQKRR
ncbi:MAG: penicillin-binding transpeptidase domain-containing protein [bacterium]|nr:penicillin-binding transpeptidase domain-containing protein [bacterium]